MAEEGIHAVLFVLSTRTRMSQEEESTLKTLQCIFDSKILDYLIVVFTGGDELEADGQTLDDYLRDGCPEFLTRALRICRGRKVLFNNRTTDKDKKVKQIKQLLAHVADVRNQNGGKPYTDQMHHQIKESKKRAAEAEASQNLTLERLKENSEAHVRALRELREAHMPVQPPRDVPVFHPFPQFRAPPPGCNIM
ncbi:unnamed protein product [Arabidopsis thaliana]|uniref:(thale cress) hypothetical protein n=1 Tax=Arabidopsis thaliana TaxID=3702 RepID=A0A7G2E132_ARATH|nr:unnamed protein product [Arabidopsis thaliana]